jgi:3-oxoacyl-[acyl-carrier-protein] synthase-3
VRYADVSIAACRHVLPDEVVPSLELEERLAPVYGRFGLSPGRLELMTGIRERRFFAPGARPSRAAAEAGALALDSAEIDRARVGLLVHAAVSRDFLEPATASVVHRALDLPATCQAFDLSNACLGVANAMTVVAEAIERGTLEAGLVVAAEDGRPLVEATVRGLLARGDALGRDDLKRAFASLTIGSGAAAVLLARRELAPDAPRLVAATSRAATEHVDLCQGDHDAALGGPWMQTESEALLHAGCALAARTFAAFRGEAGFEPDAARPSGIDRVVTHQVGVAHRRLLLSALQLDPAIDFPTVESLGNTGSVSLPLSFSLAREAGHVAPGQRVAWLGIGSGLHCSMLAVRS